LDTTSHTTTSRTISEQGELVGFVWDSGLIASGSSFIYQFNTAGTYDYFCLIHPWMEGTVIVEEELVAESESGPVPEPEPVQIFPSTGLGADITIAQGSSVPGCEESYSCFSPFAVQLYVGQELTWRNDNTLTHFIGSGTPSEGLDGTFFSDSLGISQYFSHQFDEAGTYEYYELYHPWMTGIVHVLPVPETMNVTVINAPGSSVPGCEETNSCFVPSTVIVDIAGTVTWENQDNAMHTVTSGSTGDGFDGVFDSGMMFENSDPFSHTFYAPGTYEYYCMIHPWMGGTVIVGEG
jgi:plastocyanin